MENNSLINSSIPKEETLIQQDGTRTTISRTSVVTNNIDGSKTITNTITTLTKTNKIKLDENTKIQSFTKEIDNEEKIYLNCLKTKNELAILKGENFIICNINLKSCEKIFMLMGEILEENFEIISFGIYSSEEIYEMKQKVETKTISNDIVINNRNNNNNFVKTWKFENDEKEKKLININNETFNKAFEVVDNIMEKIIKN